MTDRVKKVLSKYRIAWWRSRLGVAVGSIPGWGVFTNRSTQPFIPPG